MSGILFFYGQDNTIKPAKAAEVFPYW